MNSVYVWMIIRIALDSYSKACVQNDPKDFLNTEESMRELSSGKDSAKLFAGMVKSGSCYITGRLKVPHPVFPTTYGLDG